MTLHWECCLVNCEMAGWKIILVTGNTTSINYDHHKEHCLYKKYQKIVKFPTRQLSLVESEAPLQDQQQKPLKNWSLNHKEVFHISWTILEVVRQSVKHCYAAATVISSFPSINKTKHLNDCFTWVQARWCHAGEAAKSQAVFLWSDGVCSNSHGTTS